MPAQATIEFDTKDILGEQISVAIRAVPLDTPYADGDGLVLSGEKTEETDEDGLLTWVLQAGSYRFFFGSRAQYITKTVPDDEATYAFVDLTGDALPYTTAANLYVAKAGSTMTGPLQFSGTTHGGIRVISLTTAQRDAIATPLTGSVIWNSTTAQLERYGASSWAAVSSGGSGDVVGPASAVDSNFSAFDTTTGKLLKDSGKAVPSGTVVGTTDTQTLTNKTVATTSNAQTGTTYTLVLTDASKLVTLSNGSAITLTVPPDSDVAFDVGTTISVIQLGAGQVTVAPGSGVTLSSRGAALKCTGQYSAAALHKLATDTWVVFGDITT